MNKREESWSSATKVAGQLDIDWWKNEGCKWPVATRPQTCCGLPKNPGSSYCEGHSKMGHNGGLR